MPFDPLDAHPKTAHELESQFLEMQPTDEELSDGSFEQYNGHADDYLRTLTPADLESALAGEAPRVRTSILYMLGLLMTAATMVLLLAVYLAIIAAAGYLVYLHAVNNTGMIGAIPHSVRGTALMVILYVTPIGAGAVLIMFMIKPFAASPGKIVDSVPLNPEEEETLFYFVGLICRALRAPVPVRIEVDPDINASASFAGGFFSMLRRKLKLRIGLPLAAGLTVNQLASVLAHEFGHFSQGWGMRLTYVIRSINIWFARVVYERDAWDEYLKREATDNDARLALIFWLTILMIWIVRRILWVLMHLGHFISCFMLRRMEYNADRYAFAFAGSETFIELNRQLHMLYFAQRGVINDLREAYRENRLGDEYPTLVAQKVEEIPQDQAHKLIEHIQQQRTGFFSTHPSDGARIRMADRLDQEGIFDLDSPAELLFENYHRLVRIVTMMYYVHEHELRVNDSNLVSTQELTERRQEISSAREVESRFFQNVFNKFHPPVFKQPALEHPDNFNETGQKIIAARKDFKRTAPHALKFLEMLQEQASCASDASMALALVKAKFRINPQEFQLVSSDKKRIQSALEDADRETKNIRDQLDGMTSMARERMYCALQMLYNKRVAEQMGENRIAPEEAEKLFRCLSQLGQRLYGVWELERQHNDIMILIGQLQANADNEDLRFDLDRRVELLRKKLEQLLNILGGVDYPFEHSNTRARLGQYLCGGTPGMGAEAINRAGQFLDNYWALYQRLTGTLAQIGENVETALGLKPIQPPDAEMETAPAES